MGQAASERAALAAELQAAKLPRVRPMGHTMVVKELPAGAGPCARCGASLAGDWGQTCHSEECGFHVCARCCLANRFDQAAGPMEPAASERAALAAELKAAKLPWECPRGHPMVVKELPAGTGPCLWCGAALAGEWGQTCRLERCGFRVCARCCLAKRLDQAAGPKEPEKPAHGPQRTQG